MDFKVILIFAVSLFSTVSYAQKPDMDHTYLWSRGYAGYVFNNRVVLGSNVYPSIDLAAGVRTLPRDSSVFAAAYGYPKYGIGTSIAFTSILEVPESSRFGNYYSIYGYFERDLMRTGIFTASYRIETGFAYNPVRYSPVTNPLNLYVSSILMVHAAAALGLDFRICPNWTLSLDVRAKHYSNGRSALPNYGLNMVEAGIALKGYLHQLQDAIPVHSMKRRDGFEKGFTWQFALHSGAHCTASDWKLYNSRVADPQLKQTVFKAYPRFSFSVAPMYRYALKYSSGLALDVFWVPDMDVLERNEQLLDDNEPSYEDPGYLPVYMGIALVQEFHYRSFALNFALGLYPQRPSLGRSGDVSWNYQKAGLRYYLPVQTGLFVGIGMKANDFQESEYVEFTIGVRL